LLLIMSLFYLRSGLRQAAAIGRAELADGP
jgi:hypothetical protein